jgi:DNA-binding CsgD family transcriptional regulator/tetratricopeptide (TPR) repeat protein
MRGSKRIEKGPLRAGEAALRQGAWSEARRQFNAALRSRQTPEALEGLGWAEWWLDRPPASFAARERAYALYRKRGDRRSAARVATALAVDHIDYRGEPAVGRGWIERSRRLLEGLERTPEYGWALLWQGHWARVVGRDPLTAQQRGIEAAALARELDLFDLEMLANALQGLALVDVGKVDEGMRRLDEAMAAALSGDMTELDAIGQTCCFLVHACQQVHDFDRAVQWCTQVKSFCQRWHVKTLFTICRTNYAAVLISRGAWVEAERELQVACKQGDSRPYVARAAWVQLAELRRRQGRTEEARRLYDRAANHSLALLGRAALALSDGDCTSAADLADRFLRTVTGDVPMEIAQALELRTYALCAANRVGEADQTLTALRDVSKRLNSSAMRALVVSAEAAVAAARRDHDQARRLYQEAIDLFTAAQMPHEAESTRQRAAAVPATGSASGPKAPITSREREVLRLVAQGLSDRRMAVRLKLSEHTIHRHVSNILTKLGASSRSAAVALAVRDSLI